MNALRTKNHIATLLIKSAIINIGWDYDEVSQNGATTFSFPRDRISPAKDTLNYAKKCACHPEAVTALEKVKLVNA